MKTTFKFVIKLFPIFFILIGFAKSIPQWHVANEGQKYLIESDEKYNWLQAHDECARQGLQLVIIDNEVKNAGLETLLRNVFRKSPNLWLGHHDEFNTEKDTKRPFYSISTGEKLPFTNWNRGEPNNGRDGEHCAQIVDNGDFRWNDYSCNKGLFGYICEEPLLNSQNCTGNITELVAERREMANILNFVLVLDYANDQNEIGQILEKARNNTKDILQDLNKASNEIIANSKSAYDDIVRKKPYLAAVIADVGDSMMEILLEAKKEMAKATSEAQQKIGNEHLSAMASCNEISRAFGKSLGENRYEIDKLFVL